MNLKISPQTIKKLKSLLNKKGVLDVIIFASIVKGKSNPNDIDVAVILENDDIKIDIDDESLHISKLKVEDFFINPISLVNTLLREGYSLRHSKPFSSVFRFTSKVLFYYELTNLSNSNKVRFVNIIRGKNNLKGLVEKYDGEWISNQVFLSKISEEKIFEELFNNFNVKYKKTYILMH